MFSLLVFCPSSTNLKSDAARAPEVGSEKLQALAVKVPLRGALAQFAVAQVQRFLDLAPQGLYARSPIHATAGKDFFACSRTPFYNCGVLKTNEFLRAWMPLMLFRLGQG